MKMRGAGRTKILQRLLDWPSWLRRAFWSAALFALVMAILPKPPQLPGSPSDKIQHIAAFVVLAALAAAAYPRTSLMRIAVWLSLFGALIEFLQALPMLHRDSDARDWIADTLAAALVLLLVRLWRRRARRTIAASDRHASDAASAIGGAELSESPAAESAIRS
ncbi:MAG: hypothetical protein JWL76_2463 [Thermoleophilia bacterium]|nr:hypothetical protein [Thermoleophilia bacterium]